MRTLPHFAYEQSLRKWYPPSKKVRISCFRTKYILLSLLSVSLVLLGVIGKNVGTIVHILHRTVCVTTGSCARRPNPLRTVGRIESHARWKHGWRPVHMYSRTYPAQQYYRQYLYFVKRAWFVFTCLFAPFLLLMARKDTQQNAHTYTQTHPEEIGTHDRACADRCTHDQITN